MYSTLDSCSPPAPSELQCSTCHEEEMFRATQRALRQREKDKSCRTWIVSRLSPISCR